MSDPRSTHCSHARPRQHTATIGRATTITVALTAGVLLNPLVLAGLLALALITTAAALSGDHRA